jgi:hypothetical protein
MPRKIIWFCVFMLGLPLILGATMAFVSLCVPALLWCIMYETETPPEPDALLGWWMALCKRNGEGSTHGL